MYKDREGRLYTTDVTSDQDYSNLEAEVIWTPRILKHLSRMFSCSEARDIQTVKQLIHHLNKSSCFGDIWIACQHKGFGHWAAEYLNSNMRMTLYMVRRATITVFVTNLSCQVNSHLAERGEVHMLIFELGHQWQPPSTLLCTTVLVIQVLEVLPHDLLPVALQTQVIQNTSHHTTAACTTASLTYPQMTLHAWPAVSHCLQQVGWVWDKVDITLRAGKGIEHLVRKGVTFTVNAHKCTIWWSTISSSNKHHEATPFQTHHCFPERVE